MTKSLHPTQARLLLPLPLLLFLLSLPYPYILWKAQVTSYNPYRTYFRTFTQPTIHLHTYFTISIKLLLHRTTSLLNHRFSFPSAVQSSLLYHITFQFHECYIDLFFLLFNFLYHLRENIICTSSSFLETSLLITYLALHSNLYPLNYSSTMHLAWYAQ